MNPRNSETCERGPKMCDVEIERLTDARDLAERQNDLLHKQNARFRKALNQIANEHQAYDDPANRGHDLSYATGVTDGHRCAAKIARKALGEEVNE